MPNLEKENSNEAGLVSFKDDKAFVRFSHQRIETEEGAKIHRQYIQWRLSQRLGRLVPIEEIEVSPAVGEKYGVGVLVGGKGVFVAVGVEVCILVGVGVGDTGVLVGVGVTVGGTFVGVAVGTKSVGVAVGGTGVDVGTNGVGVAVGV